MTPLISAIIFCWDALDQNQISHVYCHTAPLTSRSWHVHCHIKPLWHQSHDLYIATSKWFHVVAANKNKTGTVLGRKIQSDLLNIWNSSSDKPTSEAVCLSLSTSNNNFIYNILPPWKFSQLACKQWHYQSKDAGNMVQSLWNGDVTFTEFLLFEVLGNLQSRNLNSF